ncbi:MAG TPA: RnfABCDGE type electron transport complex subunit D [Dissulfurispiraceae bacterium]|nr:RnfABCDGE type electron transport complex subunit D [Dissulfurispiraceae bacterium]
MDTVRTPKEQQLIISASPHIRSDESTSRIMWTVSAALLPATIMAAYEFGPYAVFLIALTVVSAVGFEYLYQRGMNKKVTVTDGSAVLTGLLLGLNLPPTVPFYIPLVGAAVAIVLTKQLFGGLGFNVFNPALIGRAFLLISFPKLMTIYVEPAAQFVKMDAKTTATPLTILKLEGIGGLMEVYGDQFAMYSEFLIGNRAGSIGETSSIAILIGGLFLMFRGYISWHIPVSFLGSAAVVAWIFGGEGFFTGDPILHLLGGGLMLGAFFMATDYVTSPSVKKGQLVFGVGCGLLTMLIRLKGGYPEGVMFAILIMNCFTPVIDRSFKSEVFGAVKMKKEAVKQ